MLWSVLSNNTLVKIECKCRKYRREDVSLNKKQWALKRNNSNWIKCWHTSVSQNPLPWIDCCIKRLIHFERKTEDLQTIKLCPSVYCPFLCLKCITGGYNELCAPNSNICTAQLKFTCLQCQVIAPFAATTEYNSRWNLNFRVTKDCDLEKKERDCVDQWEMRI